MLKKSIYFGVAVLFLGLILMPKGADALGLDPAISEIELTAGQKTIATIELDNESLDELKLEIEVHNFTAEASTGQPVFNFNATPTGIATWTTVDTDSITLAGGDTKSVTVTFDTPANATAGGNYVGVFFNQVSSGTDTGNVKVEQKIGTLYLATVMGAYTSAGTISTFAASDTSYTEGPVAFSLAFQNSGDVHLKPTGSVVITSMFGKDVVTIPVNGELGAVLPNNVRSYTVASWSDLGSAFGKYTATATLTAGTVTDSAAVSFWVISTTGIVIAVVVLIILIFLIIMLIKAMGGKKEPTV